MIVLELLSWIFIAFSILGARETSKTHCNLLRTNIFYSIANMYNIFYFLLTAQLPFLVVNLIFGYLSLKGIKNQRKKQEAKHGTS